MTDVVFGGVSGTNGSSVVRYGIAAAVLTAALMGPPPASAFVHAGSVKVNSVMAVTPFAAIKIDSAHFEVEAFEREVAQFYGTLQSQQESLGEDFEKVLFDNLWDLYADA